MGSGGFKKAKWGLCSFRIEYLDIRTNLLGASLPPKLRELVESSNVGVPEPTKVSSGLLSLSQAARLIEARWGSRVERLLSAYGGFYTYRL